MNLSKQFNVALEAIKKGIKAILDVYFQDFKVNLKEDITISFNTKNICSFVK